MMAINKKTANLGYILVSLAALLWGTSFVAVRWGLENKIDPLLFVSLRFITAALIFLPIAILKIPELRKLLMSKPIIMLGLINALGFTFQFVGQNFTTAGNASLFVNFYVLLIPLIAPMFLPEKFSIRIIISAVIGFIGAFMVSTNLDLRAISFSAGTIKGDLITFGAGVTWTLYILLSKKYLVENKEAGLDVFFGTIAWSAIFLLLVYPYLLIVNKPAELITQLTWRTILAIVYLAAVCTVAAFAIYMKGLEKISAGESSIYMLIEVLVAFILEWLLFGTKPELWIIVGVGLVISSVVLISIKRAAYENEKEPMKYTEEKKEKIANNREII